MTMDNRSSQLKMKNLKEEFSTRCQRRSLGSIDLDWSTCLTTFVPFT